jgi:hypothetical protein
LAILLIHAEETARPPPSDGHLVGDQKYVVFPAEVLYCLQVTRGGHDHAGSPLDQRLDDQGRQGVRLLLHQVFELLETGDPAFRKGEPQVTTIAIRIVDLANREEEGSVLAVEQVDASDTHRAQGIPVIGVAERDELFLLPLLRVLVLLPILEGDLQRHFHGCGAVVRVEDPSEPFGSESDDLLCKLD